MALYDPIKDKIYGCKRNSLVWYHEKGHQEWFKKGKEQNLQCYQWMFIQITIAVLGFLSGELIIAICGFIPIILSTISEINAWIYAFKKYYKFEYFFKNKTFK